MNNTTRPKTVWTWVSSWLACLLIITLVALYAVNRRAGQLQRSNAALRDSSNELRSHFSQCLTAFKAMGKRNPSKAAALHYQP